VFSYAVPRESASAGYAMVSDRFLLVAEAAIGPAFAQELWSHLAHPEHALVDVLSAFARHGLDRLPRFALIELLDVATSTVAVAVHGDARADLVGPEAASLSGAGLGTWVEGTAPHVAGITLTLSEAAAGGAAETLPLGRGVVRADRLLWGAPPPSPPAASAEPLLETIAVDRAALAELVASARADGRAQHPASGTDDALDEPDDRTDLGTIRGRVRGPIRRRGTAPQARLRLGADRVLELDRPVVLGRSPKPAEHPGCRLVPLASPQREISGTHLEVRLDGDTLLARDLDSTNGTVVRRPGDAPLLLRGGATAQLAPGSTLDLGEGVVALFELEGV